jgi:L-lactate dehydrogenase complex protein LldG
MADPVTLFVERGRAVAATVEICATVDDAAVQAAAWLAARGARRVVAWDDPDVSSITGRLAASGFEITLPGVPPEVVARADAGLTGAAWGIAETASLVLPADPQRPRLFSLLPPLHVAVLRAGRILPDLPALFKHLQATGPSGLPHATLPSALAFVSGPSRSADIGLVPVQGAHGPMEVMVLVVTGQVSARGLTI